MKTYPSPLLCDAGIVSQSRLRRKLSPAAPPEKMRSVEKEGSEATGIAAAPAAAPLLKDAPVYDLNGRRVGKADAIGALPKGVYIVNGKKVIR